MQLLQYTKSNCSSHFVLKSKCEQKLLQNSTVPYVQASQLSSKSSDVEQNREAKNLNKVNKIKIKTNEYLRFTGLIQVFKVGPTHQRKRMKMVPSGTIFILFLSCSFGPKIGPKKDLARPSGRDKSFFTRFYQRLGLSHIVV